MRKYFGAAALLCAVSCNQSKEAPESGEQKPSALASQVDFKPIEHDWYVTGVGGKTPIRIAMFVDKSSFHRTGTQIAAWTEDILESGSVESLKSHVTYDCAQRSFEIDRTVTENRNGSTEFDNSSLAIQQISPGSLHEMAFNFVCTGGNLKGALRLADADSRLSPSDAADRIFSCPTNAPC